MENNASLAFLKLPENVQEQVFALINPYSSYFNDENSKKYSAIMCIEDERFKYKHLTDLEDETSKMLTTYIKEYKDFCFKMEAGDLINFLGVPDSIISTEFSRHGEVFFALLINIRTALRDLEIKLEYEKRYKNIIEYNNSEVTLKKEFQKLFVQPIIESKFIELLIDAEYLTVDEKWKGVSGRPGELREAYRVLKMLNLLVPGKHTLTSLKIFYKRFGLKYEEPGDKVFYISIKSLSSQTITKDYDLFLELLSPLSLIRN
jgi:hypothetical protein